MHLHRSGGALRPRGESSGGDWQSPREEDLTRFRRLPKDERKSENNNNENHTTKAGNDTHPPDDGRGRGAAVRRGELEVLGVYPIAEHDFDAGVVRGAASVD